MLVYFWRNGQSKPADPRVDLLWWVLGPKHHRWLFSGVSQAVDLVVSDASLMLAVEHG